MALAVLAILAFDVPSSSKADTLNTYDVSATYNGGSGSVTGNFTFDATTGVVTSVDLSVSASGYISAFTDTTASDFAETAFTGYGTLQYLFSGGPNLDDTVFLYFDPSGGSLYDRAFETSIVNDYFCSNGGGNNNCGYAVDGSATLQPSVATTPVPGSLALFGSALAALAAFGFSRSRKTSVLRPDPYSVAA